MNIMKYILLLLLCTGVIFSCKSEIISVNKPKNESSRSFSSLFIDTLYRNGFKYGFVFDGVPGDAGRLTYGGHATQDPVWGIAQWNNYNNDLQNATFKNIYPIYQYMSTHGTGVVVDVESGTLQLRLNTESEYGHSKVCPVNPRRSSDKWPHLLLASNFSNDCLLPLVGKDEVVMDIDFSIDEFEDKIPDGTYDPNLHAAQFQWYITVQNRKVEDDGYGEYFWFGLSYFDSRYEFSPFFSAQDGNTTGAFIYIPDMKEILSAHGSVSVGKRMHVKTDILPILRKAFNLARERGYMQKTAWEDLHIASTNIGWEVPGTYNVSSTLYAFNIRYR